MELRSPVRVTTRDIMRTLTLVVSLLAGTRPLVATAQDATAPSVVRAQQEATLASRISGVVDLLPLDIGAEFQAGEVLARIDCEIYQAEAAAAEADSSGALVALAAQEALLARGGIGKLDVDVSRARAQAAAARAKSASLREESCKVRAPFDGKVAERLVNPFEYVDAGTPIVSLVSIGTPDLEIIAPAEWLLWLRLGATGELRLDARRDPIPVQIDSLGPTVDPVSRTVKLTAVFEGPTAGILPGMSGLVVLERAE